MDNLKQVATSHKAKFLVAKYILIFVGCLIYAIGFQFFMFPNSIPSGGVTGIAMIINRFTKLPVGVLTIVMNVPLFIIAWRSFGKDFLIASIFGMMSASILVDTLALTNIVATADPLLACFVGGAIKGFGCGVMYYVGGTAGGFDIVTKLLRKKFPVMNFGTMLMLLDIVVIMAYAIIFKIYESAMYAVVAMFITSKAIDLVLYGVDNSDICYIISNKYEEIVKSILSSEMHRGVTLLEGEGAYSHQNKKIIMCVIKHTQIINVRRLVRAMDPNAFVILADAKNVFGNGFDDIDE